MRVMLDCVGWRTCPSGERSEENHNLSVTTNFTYVYVLTKTFRTETAILHLLHQLIYSWTLTEVSLSDPHLVTITAELSISVYLCMANLSVCESRVVTLMNFFEENGIPIDAIVV